MILVFMSLSWPALSEINKSIMMPDVNQVQILKQAHGLSRDALSYALKGYRWALGQDKVEKLDILTVIDFTLPSNVDRIWVLDLKNSSVLMSALTSQGKNSGVCYATRFSNRLNSHETSLGVYKTLSTYQGKHGFSLRLRGLEKGINDNALKRDIVIHPAWYVTPSFLARYHRTGRSWGCFAVNPAIHKKFINLIKGGSILFAYAEQEKQDPNLKGI